MNYRIVFLVLIGACALWLGILKYRPMGVHEKPPVESSLQAEHDSVPLFRELPPQPPAPPIHQLSDGVEDSGSPEWQHPAQQRRLRDLICYLTSDAANDDSGKSLRTLASRHGLAPDALLDAYRFAWLSTRLQEQLTGAEAELGRAHGRQATLNAVLEVKASAFQRRHGEVDPEFFEALTALQPTVPPPACGASVYQLDNDSVATWLNPASYPDFALREGWFEDTADNFLKNHAERLLELSTDPAFTTPLADWVTMQFQNLSIHPDDVPMALRTALDHRHTVYAMEEQLKSVREQFGEVFDASFDDMAIQANREMLATFEERIATYRDIVEETWRTEWGVEDPEFVRGLFDQPMEIVPQPRVPSTGPSVDPDLPREFPSLEVWQEAERQGLTAP